MKYATLLMAALAVSAQAQTVYECGSPFMSAAKLRPSEVTLELGVSDDRRDAYSELPGMGFRAMDYFEAGAKRVWVFKDNYDHQLIMLPDLVVGFYDFSGGSDTARATTRWSCRVKKEK